MTLRHSLSAVLLFSLSVPALGAGETESSDAPDTSRTGIDSITVTGILGEADRMTGSAHRVGEETLEAFSYDDINRVLNLVPGVYSREEDGAGLRPNIGLRGGSADRSQKVTLMEDGVPIAPAPYSAPAAYFFPLTSRMVGVEVFKGQSSIQYGPQTIGGAINLISASIPEQAEMLAELAGGSDAYRHLHLRGGTRYAGLGVLGEFMHLGSDGFKRLDGGGDTGFEKNEVLVKVDRNLGPGTLELRLGYADEVSNETYLGLTEADVRADALRRYRASALDRMEWEWTGGRASWSQPWLGGRLHLTGYAQNFDRAWRKLNNFNGASIRDVVENPDSPFNQLFVSVLHGASTDGIPGSPDDLRIGTNDRDFLSAGLQGGMRWAFGDAVAHTLEIGARYHTDRIRRLHDEFGYEQTVDRLVQNSQPRAIVADNTGYTEALALWLRDEVVHGRWTFVPGLRVEAIDSSFTNQLLRSRRRNDYVVVLPGLGVSMNVRDGFSLLAGVHKGFSPATPSLSEDLKAEEAVNYELGGRWHGTIGRVELIGFYNDYSNLTATCTVSSGCSPSNLDTQTNAGEVRAYGLEAGWNDVLSLTSSLTLPVALTYTYTDAAFRESFTSTDPQFGDVRAGFELPYIPPHRANASVGLDGSFWGLQLSVTHVARMRDQAGTGPFDASEGSDAYTVLDLAGYYDLAARWTLSGRIDNLLDEEYVVSRRPYGARPGKPLGFQFELTYRY